MTGAEIINALGYFAVSCMAGYFLGVEIREWYAESRTLDRLYAWFWRVPACTPGHCYCRRTCECLDQEQGV